MSASGSMGRRFTSNPDGDLSAPALLKFKNWSSVSYLWGKLVCNESLGFKLLLEVFDMV